MDWFSKEKKYQIVPKDEELTYGFTPPDSLLQQIVCSPESYTDLDRYNIEGSKLTNTELSVHMQGLSYEVNRGEVVYGLKTINQFSAVDCGNEILECLTPRKTGLLGDVLEKLDGAGAINRVDENLLISQPISTQLDSQTACNSHLTDMTMTCHSIPFDLSNEAGSNEETSMLGAGASTRSSSLEVPVDSRSVCQEDVGYMNEERMLLQDVELVIRQMTRDSRVCVRDALYRLAKRSKDIIMDVPALSLRSGGMHHIESETNAIDRTIANLMFSEVDMSCMTL